MASRDKEPKLQGGVADLIRNAGKKAKSAIEATAGNGDLSIQAEDGSQVRIFNILSYIEQPWGLGLTLYPVQKFIVKLYYGVELDDQEKTIEITDRFRTSVLYQFTEKEYLRYLASEGRCNISEQDHMRRQLLLSIGRRAGKCVEADSLVLTDKGIFRIEDLAQAPEEEFSPLEVGVAQEAGCRAKSSHFYNGGVKPTFRLQTKSGYTICGTGNHRVKVMSPSGQVEWRYLDDIRQGDFVAINRNSDLWASALLDLRSYHNDSGYKDTPLPDELDERLGNLLGYLVGDGTWGDDHAISVTVEHPETWGHLRNLFAEVFGESRTQMDPRTNNTGRLEFCSVRWRRFLDAIGWKLGTGRYEKMVPWAILRSPKSVVCAFLRGLFETDGCAEGGGRNITFSTASFRLAHEVQVLLLNLGILTTLERKWNTKTKRHYATLIVKGVRSRTRFAELIGFDSDKKRCPMLDALLSAEEGKSDTESIPCQYTRLRDLVESIPKRKPGQGWGRSKLREVLGNSIKPTSGEDLTYSRLQRLLEVVREDGVEGAEVSHFEELQRLDYFYDAVVSREEREDQVYDLTVPEGHSFVANGFTNHNTTLSAIFASYELYRLLSIYNPQMYYGLPNGNRIQLISVATEKDQAGLLFNDVTSHLAKCEFFKPFIANNTQSHVQFRTQYDIDKYGPTVRKGDGKFVSFNGKASVRITFKAAVSKGLRGSGNIIVILDEMAHFQDNNGAASAKAIYDAVVPSTLAFSPKDHKTKKPVGEVEARVICISSPLNTSGKFYELYQWAMTKGEGSDNVLAIQAPTWEVNPTVEPGYLRQKYHEDPAVFMTEYGAQFSDRVRGWIEREQDLIDCVRKDLRPKSFGPPRFPHQMGIDVGLVNDGTSIFVTHAEGHNIVLDYHETWYAGVPWREANPHLTAPMTDYPKTLESVARIDFEQIALWILALTKRFYVTDGLFDRWNGFPLEETLHKYGLKQFRSEFFSRDATSKMYQVVKGLMFDKRLVLYDWPLPRDAGPKHSPFIEELLRLQAKMASKNQIVVEAPNILGAHDDMADAYVRAVWLTAERIRSQKIAAKRIDEGQAGKPAMSLHHYHMSRARNHGIFMDRVARNIRRPF